MASQRPRRLFIVPDVVSKRPDSAIFVSLPHPKTGQAARFMISHQDNTLYEVQKFEDPDVPRSWIIQDSVVEDGSLMVVSKMDPVFVCIPLLRKHAQDTTHFSVLDEILHDPEFPSVQRLEHCKDIGEICRVCDVRGADDIQAFRFNESKCLAWLSNKVDQVVSAFQRHNVTSTGASLSVGYTQSSKAERKDSDSKLKQAAVGVLSEYLADDLADKLYSHLGIVKETNMVVPANDDRGPGKYAGMEPEDDYSRTSKAPKSEPAAKKPKLTPAQRSLAKVNKKGMKSIASFFGKPKKTG